MKSRILKNYGVTGVEVTLNVADQMQVGHAIDRIDETIKEYDETGGFIDNAIVIEELKMVRIFLRKLALEESAKPTIFEEEIPVETQE